MKISNLYHLPEVTIQLASINVLCGLNNTGKTYITYFVYALLDDIFNYYLNDRLSLLSEQEIDLLVKYKEVKISISDSLLKVYNQYKSLLMSRLPMMLSECFLDSKDAFKNTIVEFSFQEFIDLTLQSTFLKEGVKRNSYYIIRTNEGGMLKGKMSSHRNGNTLYLCLSDEYPQRIFPRETENSDFDNLLKDKIENLIIENKNQIVVYANRFLTNTLFKHPNLLFLPAERSGLSLVREEITQDRLTKYNDIARDLWKISNQLVSTNKVKDQRNTEFIESLSEAVQSYPKPISDYISFLTSSTSHKDYRRFEEESFSKDLQNLVQRNLVEGKFIVDQEGVVFFTPSRGNKQFSSIKLPYYRASSSSKALFGLDWFLRNHIAPKGSVLFIDEPELNLHPEKQLEFCKLFDIFVQNNITLFITTHSDYVVRKLFNIAYTNKNSINRNNLKFLYFSNQSIKSLDFFEEANSYLNFRKANIALDEEYINILEESE